MVSLISQDDCSWQLILAEKAVRETNRWSEAGEKPLQLIQSGKCRPSDFTKGSSLWFECFITHRGTAQTAFPFALRVRTLNGLRDDSSFFNTTLSSSMSSFSFFSMVDTMLVLPIVAMTWQFQQGTKLNTWSWFH